jgi:TetR/AcrR family transcriptional regulator
MNEHQVQEKHGDVELKIMNAARSVFAEMGFGGARMEEIARRAGVNKATIYYHIGDKKELYAAVIHQVIGNTTDRIAENIGRAATPEEKIVVYIKTIAEAMDMNPQMPPLIMREIASGGDNLPDVFVLEDFARLIGIVKGILDEGISAGVFAETPPLILHFMVVSTFAVYSMTTPIREKLQGISGNLLLPGNKLSGYFAEEVAKMIVKALRRR